MPLVHSEKIEETSTLLVWNLTETENELSGMLDSPHNSFELNSISHPQKKREWMASRLLIKILTEEFGSIYKGTYKDDHGKVFLSQQDAHISITHTHDYVAAILDPVKPVGIDMEKLDPKLRRTAKKFLNDQELAHASDDLTLLAMYWCAKEAIYKLYGKTKVSFKDDIQVLSFSSADEELSGFIKAESLTVHSKFHLRWFGEYCLAIAV
jgi:4'-phosphopantetheinyl transferase